MVCPTDLLHPSPAPNFTTVSGISHLLSDVLSFSTIQSYDSNVALFNVFLKCKSNFLVERVFFLLNAAFAIAILDLIPCVQLAAFIMLPK
jgi:hypothetical protein